MANWLTTDLKEEVRKVFEPRYGRHLTDSEVKEIAENLTDFLEVLLKYRLRLKYENPKN